LALALALSGCGAGEPSSPAPAPAAIDPPAAAAADHAEAAPDPAPTRSALPWRRTEVLVPVEARAALLAQAVEAERRGDLFGSAPLGALDLYAALASAEPPMPEAEVGRERVLEALASRFELARLAGRFDDAEAIAAVLEVERADGDADRRAMLAQARAAAQHVAAGDARRQAGRWLSPRGDSAVFHYREALALQPGYVPAQQGLAAVERALIDRAEAAAAGGDYIDADADLARAARIGRHPAEVQDARAALAQRRAARAAEALAAATVALDRLDLPTAARALAEAQAADAQATGLDAAAQRLATARRYGHFLPGQRFADAFAERGSGPAMVVIQHGTFRMGSGDDEPGARDNERPARSVRFERGFALAVHETTVAEFSRFIAATGYRTVAERSGRSSAYDERGGAMVGLRGAHWRRSYTGRGLAAPDLPVVHVAFEDAVAYAEWLSARTGQRYRLPSEAEFEYALRAGVDAAWPWGTPLPRRALGNLTGDGDTSPQGRRWGRPIRGWDDGHWGPSAVGSFPAEGFGTRDLIGNVSEWVEDCWHDGYRRAPSDGRAWVNSGCRERVVRGGSWASTLEQARSAFRLQVPQELSSARIGFRVARDI